MLDRTIEQPPSRLDSEHFSARLTSADILDYLDTPLLVVDRTAKVLLANRSAEEFIRTTGDLSTRCGFLTANDCLQTSALRRLIAVCVDDTEAAQGTFALARGARTSPLLLEIAAVRGAPENRIEAPGLAIVSVTDPEQVMAASCRQLRHRFGLTRAEAAVASELLRGDGLQAVASRLGISLETVRTHRSQVFAKTGTSRQAELVRVVLAWKPTVRSGGGPFPAGLAQATGRQVAKRLGT